MVTLTFDVLKFKGIAQAYGSTNGAVIECDNFDSCYDSNATSIFHSFLTKFPLAGTLGDKISTSISRGLFLFVPGKFSETGLYRYVQAFSDGTVRYYNSTTSTWDTINSTFNANYPYSFATYPASDTLYWANWAEGVYKWKANWSAGVPLPDKGGTHIHLSGTLTFTEDSKIVTGAGTAFTTELTVGDWIAIASAEDWYEVDTIVDATNLTLYTVYGGITASGTVGASIKAPLMGRRGRFVYIWKDRLYVAAGAIYYNLLQETGFDLLQENGDKILIS